MAANSTLGINVYYAWQTTAGVKPSTGFTLLSDEITEIPEFDTAPEGLDATPLSELVSVRRIPGLKDNGDDFSLTVNMSQTLITAWATIVSAAATNIPLGKYLELMIVIPDYTDAYFISGTPVALGFAGASVNEVFQGALHITPYQDHGWATKGTITTA